MPDLAQSQSVPIRWECMLCGTVHETYREGLVNCGKCGAEHQLAIAETQAVASLSHRLLVLSARLSPKDSETCRQAAGVIETQGQLRAALALAIRWADSTIADWDAGRDSKVGKKLSALAGRLKHYAPDTDIIHSVFASTQAAARAAKEK